MVTSIGGPSDRWTQIAALQSPQAARRGGDRGQGFDNDGSITTDVPPVNPVAGRVGPPLSNDINYLLTMFGGGSHSSARPSLPSSAPPAASASTPAPRQDPASATAQLQPDARLTRPNRPASAAADGATGSTLVQELQALVSGGGGHASTVGHVAAPPTGAAGGSDAIQNTNSAVPSWHNGWDNTIVPNDRGRQQAGLAAYASGDYSGKDSATASALPEITA